MSNVFHFPGGATVIDESRVWRMLSAWITRNEARGASCTFARAPKSDEFVCFLAMDLESDHWETRSRLSIADAVANALQAAEAAGT